MIRHTRWQCQCEECWKCTTGILSLYHRKIENYVPVCIAIANMWISSSGRIIYVDKYIETPGKNNELPGVSALEEKMIKEMDEFMDEAVKEIKQRLGGEYDVAWDIYHKNNGVLLRGIRISDRASNVSPCIYMEGIYMAYKESGNMELVVEDVIHIYEENRGLDFSTGKIMDREQMLEQVLFRLVNTKRNHGVLPGIPHRDLYGLGLSMVFYIPFQTGGFEQASMTVNNRLMEIWGVSEAEILDHAQKNAPEKMPVCMFSVKEAVCNIIGQAADWSQEILTPLYVLTNKQKIYGAGCMLYNGVLEQAAKQYGSSLYILPSSIHEVILLPAKAEWKNRVKELAAMVASINRSDVIADEEVLSDEVYYYSKDRHELVIAS